MKRAVTKDRIGRLAEARTLLSPAALALLLLSLTFYAGCAPPEPIKLEDPEAAAATLKSWSVRLPPPVNLQALIPPLRDTEGTLRIDGVLRRADDFYSQSITLSGYLTGKSPKCPRRSKRCVAPYFWLSQDPPPASDEVEGLVDEHRRIKVVSIKREQLRRLKVGQRYQVTGKLVTEADGFVRSIGLLVFSNSERLTK